MKILFLNTNIGYGGASKIIVWVANQLAKTGHDVTFLTYRDNIIRQPLESTVKLIQAQLEETGGDVKLLHSVKWIHRLIKENNFDLGIAFLPPSILRLALASKGTGIKLIFSQRGDPYYTAPSRNFKSKLIGKLNTWAFNQADGYVFQTKMALAYYSDAIQKKSAVIPNPISPMLRTEVREGNIRKSFVAVGRLDLKHKRQDLLIGAFNLISAKYPDYKLEIYGDGEDESKVAEMAVENPRIQLMGKTDNVASVIQNACATVLSSDSEGIPNAVLESMSLGVPCISTDCSPGGAAMLIRNYENGLLVPRGDIHALANAMEYIINHPVESERMAVQAMEVNQIYAEKNIAEKWELFLKQLSRI